MKNIWVFGPLYAVFIFFSIHSWIWTPTGPGETRHWWDSTVVSLPNGPSLAGLNYTFVGFSILWLLLTLVVGTIVQVMAQKAQLDVSEGKSPTYDKLWATVKELGWRMFGLYIIAGLIILIGFLLLIIPGIFMVKRYFMAPYVMLDEKLGIRASLDRSAAISPTIGSVWGVVLVVILLSFISVIPIIGWLISFVLSILYSVAPALRYQELKKIAS